MVKGEAEQRAAKRRAVHRGGVFACLIRENLVVASLVGGVWLW